MLVQPMSSLSGYVTYLKYQAGTAKGGVEVGDVFNSPYTMGKMDEDRMRYSSAAVSETHDLTTNEINSGIVKLSWTPVASVVSVSKNVTTGTGDAAVTTRVDFDVVTLPDGVKPTGKQVTLNKDGALEFAVGTIGDADNNQIKVNYFYNNEIVPQTVKPTSLPTLKAKMQAINLTAHARRIAVYYSQIAAFQAKNDYGMDLQQQLSAQAQGELAYEIDTEGVMMLSKGAEMDKRLQLSAYNGTGAISRSQYYEAMTELFARASAIIYERTQKFAANYAIIAADVLPVMGYLNGWVPAPASAINGPYFAGTLNNVKVYLSPALKSGEMVFGVNGADLQTSAAVYAPYMAIVPTQLLGFADGTMSQGFSTMYDMKLLSTYDVTLNADGTIKDRIDAGDGENGQYSYLLVKGQLLFDGDAYALPVNVVNAADFNKATVSP